MRASWVRCVASLCLVLAACGCNPGDAGDDRPPRGRGGPGPGTRGGGPPATAAVPIEVATVERRDVSSFIETNGTLEAENEVDVVARISGPIVELRAEEGMPVDRGDVLARLEQDEIRAQLEVSRVELEETKLAYERAESLRRNDLISSEEYEQARAAYEAARAQFEANEVQFGYTEIRAPFGGLIVARYVDFGQQVTANTALFRISDFTPLLCPIQIPEGELRKLRVGQRAHLSVKAFPGERFPARVLRVRPVVDADTGTVRVTLEVEARGKLRPGMFARVFLETDVHRDTLVIPKQALALESIGDTVYVAVDGVAQRREVTLGFEEADHVEIVSGVAEGDRVVVVGQDGLSQGTPVRVLRRDGETVGTTTGGERETAGATASGEPALGRGRGLDPAELTPERIERIKERMRLRGMSEEQIEARIRAFRERVRGEGEDGGSGGPDPP